MPNRHGFFLFVEGYAFRVNKHDFILMAAALAIGDWSNCCEGESLTLGMTVMNRLLDKGHLTKTTVGTGRNRVAKFSPVHSKEQFLEEQTKAVTRGLLHDFGGLVVNHMIDALDEVDSEIIARLERKLNEMKSDKAE